MLQEKLREITHDQLTQDGELIVAGDIHGDFSTFRKIMNLFDPDKNYLIFLGDYADRGSEGVEVIDGMRTLIEEHPNKVIALKGNHEDYTPDGEPRFKPCDLVYEASHKKGGWSIYFKNELNQFLDQLYLAVLLQGKILLLHGGVSSKVKSLKDLRYPSRDIEQDIIWSDPFEGEGEYSNPRGVGVEFGNDVSKGICNRLGVQRILRSHQPTKAMQGPFLEHNGRIVTISSTVVYGGIPYILVLPTNNLGQAFENLGRYTISFE
jgi:predicted phosphodiesterase